MCIRDRDVALSDNVISPVATFAPGESVPATPKMFTPDLMFAATRSASPATATLDSPSYPLSGCTVCAVLPGVTDLLCRAGVVLIAAIFSAMPSILVLSGTATPFAVIAPAIASRAA